MILLMMDILQIYIFIFVPNDGGPFKKTSLGVRFLLLVWIIQIYIYVQ